MQTVELKSAYHWHCPTCANENFALPRKSELTDDDREDAFREFHGLDEWAELPEGWRQFELVMIPNEVMCADCEEWFSTVDERDADLEGE